MSTEYFIVAGNEIIEQFDVNSNDHGFRREMAEFKSTLSDSAKKVLLIVSEYVMFPDDGEQPIFEECCSELVSEIKSKWLDFYQ